MKIISIIAVLIAFTTSAQMTRGKLYKSDHWADVKGNGGFGKALDHPTHEKVEILITEKYVRTTFGEKVFEYSIISFKRFAVRVEYTVELSGKTYVIGVADMLDGTHTINVDGVWMVSDIRDIKTIDVK